MEELLASAFEPAPPLAIGIASPVFNMEPDLVPTPLMLAPKDTLGQKKMSVCENELGTLLKIPKEGGRAEELLASASKPALSLALGPASTVFNLEPDLVPTPLKLAPKGTLGQKNLSVCEHDLGTWLKIPTEG